MSSLTFFPLYVLSWRNPKTIQFILFLMHSQVLYHRLLCILYFPVLCLVCRHLLWRNWWPWKSQAVVHVPVEDLKQRKTFRFHMPGFKMPKSLICYSHWGVVGCSDCSNSLSKMTSSVRTCLLRVSLLTLTTASSGHKPWRTESKKGCSQGGKDKASGSFTQGNASIWHGPAVLKQCNLHWSVLADVLTSFH